MIRTHNPCATLLLVVSAIALSGCERPAELAATEVLNEINCRGAAPGLKLATFAEVAALRGSTLLGMSAEPIGNAATTPELILLTLSKGRQPTPGYQFHLRDAYLEERTATLAFEWQTPKRNAALAQITTNPCMVVGLEAGEFDVIQALDEDDNLLGELRIH